MITVTNPSRVLYPETGHTKGQIVDYYRRAATRLLPHLSHRPLTIHRFPRGVGQKGFFQKNAPAHYPDYIERIELPRQGGVTVHPCVHDADGIVFIANQGAIELHIPIVRAPKLYYPDRLILDLDPPSGEVALVREAAHTARAELDAFGIMTLPVATGAKGYHLVAAIEPSMDLGAVGTAMHKFATLLVHRHPALFTGAFRIKERGRRVFVDWLRNRYGATAIAPYSLRARPRPSIAVPLVWDELDEKAPDAFDIDAIDLERADPLLELAPIDARAPLAAIERAFDEAALELEAFDRFRS
ncbi:MAG TPA: non-homologous end-joining DNA ligase [Polyangiaceae bacterium]|nr:non-homologous end-joining DNA ligase [Polyangiaceae bacterium]